MQLPYKRFLQRFSNAAPTIDILKIVDKHCLTESSNLKFDKTCSEQDGSFLTKKGVFKQVNGWMTFNTIVANSKFVNIP
jgi:hypothetical protein